MRVTWLLIAVLAVGCRQKPDEVIEEAQKSAESWRETLAMTVQQWIDDRVPARYVKQIFKAADKELGKELQKLEKIPEGQKVQKQIERLRGWAGNNFPAIGEVDHKTRQEMLASLPRDDASGGRR